MAPSGSDSRHGYPRPQLERASWTSLNGRWQFAIDEQGSWAEPGEVQWSGEIVVPFAPQTAESGVADASLFRACWYRRTFDAPALAGGQRLLLHFGAVDYRATVWVNGLLAAHHEGGYTPFTIDLTRFLTRAGAAPVTIVVLADDDPTDLAKPRGKQDWQPQPHSIWYPRTSGIWQTVWFESVARWSVASLQWTPNLERWEVGLHARVDGPEREGLRLAVKLHADGRLLADDSYAVIGGEVNRRLALSDPGVDDSRNELLWSPASPTIISAEVRLWGERGELLDSVRSYTALRAIDVHHDRVLVNGRPLFLRMVLDQGYWPGTGLTAPDDEALRRDVELAKAMGFNGVRKHQKIEDPRYLYWADTLGLLVWEEMPSAYRFTEQSIERLTREWMAVLERDFSHPCIIAWVPLNESWGVPNLPANPFERHYVQALYHLTKTFDPTRPVIGNDGWESVATDIIGIHDYDPDASNLARRYGVESHRRPSFFRRERPAGRQLLLHEDVGQPIVLSECGGLAMAPDPGAWGYATVRNPTELAARYGALVAAVGRGSSLAGFCYTQFADTYQEVNGLLTADRTAKCPLPLMSALTRELPEAPAAIDRP